MALERKLTQAFIEKISTDKEKLEVVDSVVPVLRLIVRPTGRKVFQAYVRVNGRQSRPGIGSWPTITLDEARRKARRIAADADEGIDLALRRADARKEQTLDEFAERWFRDHASIIHKARTVYANRSLYRVHISPKLGRLALSKVTRDKVAEMFAAASQMRATAKPGRPLGGKVAANRSVALLSMIMTTAEDWNLIPKGSDPAKRQRRHKEHRRRGALSPDAIKRLSDACREAAQSSDRQMQIVADLIELSLLTGVRPGEMRTARASHVQADEKVLALPNNKEQDKWKLIYLGPDAWAIVAKLKLATASDWLFPSERREDQPISPPRGAWDKIRGKAGLPDTTLHDLRHTWASTGLDEDFTLDQIGDIMGHADPTTTKRYAYLLDGTRRTVSNEIEGRVAQLMGRRRK